MNKPQDVESFLHLGKPHEFFPRSEDFLLVVVNLELGLVLLVDHLEGPILHVIRDAGVGEIMADDPLSVEHGVGGIAGHLNLSEDPKEPLGGKHGVDLLQRELLLLALVLHPKIQLVVVLKQ